MFANNELNAVLMPGAIAIPAIFAFLSTAVKERAVPKSATMQGPLKDPFLFREQQLLELLQAIYCKLKVLQ